MCPKLQVVHRDIAVRNYLVDHDGRVLLCDFGLTEFLPDGETTLSALINASTTKKCFVFGIARDANHERALTKVAYQELSGHCIFSLGSLCDLSTPVLHRTVNGNVLKGRAAKQLVDVSDYSGSLCRQSEFELEGEVAVAHSCT